MKPPILEYFPPPTQTSNQPSTKLVPSLGLFIQNLMEVSYLGRSHYLLSSLGFRQSSRRILVRSEIIIFSTFSTWR